MTTQATTHTPAHEARRKNIDVLVVRCGTLDELAKRADASPVYLSQIRHGTIDRKTGAARKMGHGMARRIEVAMGLPEGWMDVPQATAMTSAAMYPDEPFLSNVHNDVDIIEHATNDEVEMMRQLQRLAAVVRTREPVERKLILKMLGNLFEPDGDEWAKMIGMMLRPD